MTSLQITLPESLKSFIEDQAAREGYSSINEYVEAVLLEAQRRQARQELEAKLLEGIDSGPATPMTREDWNDLKRRVWERQAEKSEP